MLIFDNLKLSEQYPASSFSVADEQIGEGEGGGNQGLRASSLQFTSPLEFNAIFRDGFTLRLDLTAGSKIRDPVTAKFKHAQSL